jgi:predicted Zn-dependent protease
MRSIRGLSLLAVLAVVGLPTRPTAAQPAKSQPSAPSARLDSGKDSRCPSPADLDSLLVRASTLMGQQSFQEAANTLQWLSVMDCDARISLLLAAAVEAGGDASKATALLKRAHSVWPSNNSIAASLAREYLAVKQIDEAVKALAHFHANAETPEQEMEMAVVVYLASHQLTSAQADAEAAYKSYPSVHTLLLLTNTLQLQGRYPDVNRLLGSKRETYADSPEFFITLAESESDAGIYPDARKDLERAISLDSKLYQEHYLLGYVLLRLNEADAAIPEFHLAIELAPDQPRTYFQLALALRSKQDQTGEEQALGHALAIDGHYAPAQSEMGRILLEKHRPAEAVSHLNDAIKYNPRSEEAYFLLARAYAQLGQKDKGREVVKHLVAVRKENRPSSANNDGDRFAPSEATTP